MLKKNSVKMSVKEEKVNSLWMFDGKRISSTCPSRFPSPPGLSKRFNIRAGRLKIMLQPRVRSIVFYLRKETSIGDKTAIPALQRIKPGHWKVIECKKE